MGQLSYSIPQTGQPNASQDPLIATALSQLLTLVNGNIEATNLLPASGVAVLKPTTKSANYNAVAGDLIRVTTACTITLPGHSAGQLVGVFSQVSSGAVTVSGTNINGVGLTAATSFTLGTYGSFAVLEDNGTDWSIVAGQQDTGWQALSLSANIAASGGYTPSGRLVGDRVFLRGVMQNNTGGSLTGFNQVATIPSGLRPTQPTAWAAVVHSILTNPAADSINTTPNTYLVQTSGALYVGGLVGNTYYMPIDGLSYTLS